MQFERLFSFLTEIHPISDAFRASIERKLQAISLPKNHLLLEAPRVSDYAWFLDSGFAMSYAYTLNGMRVENFWKSGEIILSVKSFFEQAPAKENIQLMTSAEVFFISYKSVQELFQAYPEAHFIYETVVNRYYEASRERTNDMLHLGAADRYKKLLSIFPQIEQMVSQEHIASYLGIAPQSLSRLKRHMRGT
ncbi:MAG TPA: Crp/Fnr family transcriptional regulator [Cyclobacteriaceae bacterium]|nr:Crp/Fnr family transcriptional regulator [Cyclobacteriaceae bacterium]